jgi:hypothetical protein
MSTFKAEIRTARVETVTLDDEMLTARLSDGRTVSVPLTWYPRLLDATAEERNHWRLIGGGEGVHWPDLDEDVSADNLALGQPSGESQQSLQRWMESRHRAAS